MVTNGVEDYNDYSDSVNNCPREKLLLVEEFPFHGRSEAPSWRRVLQSYLLKTHI